MEKQGMPIAQPMSTVKYAAMMSALNITGKKERVLGKYMRQHLGPAFCPTQKTVSILAVGHTKVHTGSMPWIYEGKEREEMVEWTEKDLHTEIEVKLLRLQMLRQSRLWLGPLSPTPSPASSLLPSSSPATLIPIAIALPPSPFLSHAPIAVIMPPPPVRRHHQIAASGRDP